MSTTTQPDRAKVGRAFMLVGALGLVIQLAIYALTQQSMVALTTVIGFHDGWGSAVFAIAAATTLVIIYDATHVRRAVGEQGRLGQGHAHAFVERGGRLDGDGAKGGAALVAAGHELAPVGRPGFGGARREPLDGAALDLSLHVDRGDGLADVVPGGDLVYLDRPCPRIDLDVDADRAALW